MQSVRFKPMVPIAFIGAIGLLFLYLYNPQEISSFPRCPFFLLTGYKCPGCGTARAIHALLHFRIVDALTLNPLVIVSVPVMIGLLFKRFAYSVTVGKFMLIVVVGFWIMRNV